LHQARADDIVARIEADIVGALGRGDAPEPQALLFLLRRYAASDRPDLAEPVGHGLAVALTRYDRSAHTIDRAAWLRLFVDAARVSDDERLRPAIEALVETLSAEWPTHSDVERAGAAIDACLYAAEGPLAPTVVQKAIDELERIAAAAYAPGAELRSVGPYVRFASALLTAFTITARIPYAMLAEEVAQALRRRHWDEAARLFGAPLDVNCEAVRVLRRLAALHGNAEYRTAAVVAPDADYARDADIVLDSLSLRLADEPFPLAAFGLALTERGAA
jgi:hypothetical protein